MAVAVVGSGAGLIRAGTRTSAPPRPAAADAWPSASAGTSREPAATAPAAVGMGFSKPVRIRIPSIGVDAPVTEVEVDAAGNLPAPSADDRNLAGWYRQSAAPGTVGNAVIDGHVDTAGGPAVFYGLGVLHRGDTVAIVRADRSTAEFTVDAVEVYPKDAVPGDQVYGDADRPQLRLITCGGTYTKGTGYQGSVVVYAHFSRAVPA
ncbi:class F sortase [Kitasatospora sp. NPDC048365]|uniref:class F sortase n=1 Tax=Kitasatospora sp. NPDC048365 TaxID=3364050 RepID=UPI003724567E